MDVSALGFKILVQDSKIFPQGFSITRTADGSDLFAFSDLTIGEASMDANGNMVYATTPNPTEFTINLLPTSEEDKNMSLLFEAHKPKTQRARMGGKITIMVQYSDGSSTIANNCKFISGSPKKSITSPSRYTNKVYTFACESYE